MSSVEFNDLELGAQEDVVVLEGVPKNGTSSSRVAVFVHCVFH
jgi:hypothetical protein